jgi:hypothetical protein
MFGARGAGMTSNSDDLEEVFRDDLEKVLKQNLKLRRELAAEVAKVRVPKPGMYRFGWTLYWVCLTLAAVWVLISLQLVPTDYWSEISLGRAVIWFSPVLVLYGLGRALRDALSYE